MFEALTVIQSSFSVIFKKYIFLLALIVIISYWRKNCQIGYVFQSILMNTGALDVINALNLYDTILKGAIIFHPSRDIAYIHIRT